MLSGHAVSICMESLQGISTPYKMSTYLTGKSRGERAYLQTGKLVKG